MKMKSVLSTLILGSSLLARAALGGNWTEVPLPTVVSVPAYFAIASASDNDVWVVGAQYNSHYQTLTEHWDGTAWSVVSSPNPSNKQNFLLGVTAISRKNVWAVGNRVQGTVQQTLIEHWDGRRWLVVSSPNVIGSGYQNALQSISAVSANDIWAVGAWTEPNGQQHPLTLHWDGATWTLVPSPSVSYDVLFSVTALASNDVWAVGRSGNTPSLYQTLTLHWDGAAWSVVPSPNVGTGGSALAGADGTSPNDVWAVGNSGFFGINGQTLGMHWDGSLWSVVPTAHVSADEVLNATIALAPNNIWAVGEDHSAQQPISENWNGAAWSVVAVPPVPPYALLRRISVSRTGTLWALGVQNSSGSALVFMRTP